MRQTSQGPIGGRIRLLCDIGHRDQRSTKPLRVMIYNPCPKEHTAHPHCSPAGTKAGRQYVFLFHPVAGVGGHREGSKQRIKEVYGQKNCQASWLERRKTHHFFFLRYQQLVGPVAFIFLVLKAK